MSIVKDIRANTTQLLLDASTKVGSKVYNAKISPTLVRHLPAIIVFTPTVASSFQSVASPAFMEEITIEIDVIVGLYENWQDEVDDIIEEVKTALFNSKTWVEQFTHIDTYSITYVEDGSGEIPLATAVFSINTSVWRSFDYV